MFYCNSVRKRDDREYGGSGAGVDSLSNLMFIMRNK
jgi:hypothetical protein